MKQTSRGKILYIEDYQRKSWGKYALLHHDFLRNYHPRFFKQLSALGKLDERLRTIDEVAKSRFEFAENFGFTVEETEHSLFTEVIYNLK